jgi:hypothetical protein
MAVERSKITSSFSKLNQGSNSITATATNIVGTNPVRRSVVLQNLGTQFVWVGNQGIAVNAGVRIATNGGTLTLLTTDQVWGISSSGTQTLTWLETKD